MIDPIAVALLLGIIALLIATAICIGISVCAVMDRDGIVALVFGLASALGIATITIALHKLIALI